MFSWIIGSSLKFRFLVVAAAVALLVFGTSELRRMPPFEFQNWAVIALGGIPNKTQSGDKGIDGRIYPVSAGKPKKKPHNFAEASL